MPPVATSCHANLHDALMSFPLPGPISQNASERSKKRHRESMALEQQALANLLQENNQEIPEALQSSIQHAHQQAVDQSTK